MKLKKFKFLFDKDYEQDWLNEMCATLGLEAAEDETVADVCLEWGIIGEDDVNDLDEAADATFVFGTLEKAAKALSVDYAKLTEAAIKEGYLAAKDKIAGDAKDAAEAVFNTVNNTDLKTKLLAVVGTATVDQKGVAKVISN